MLELVSTAEQTIADRIVFVWELCFVVYQNWDLKAAAAGFVEGFVDFAAVEMLPRWAQLFLVDTVAAGRPVPMDCSKDSDILDRRDPM